MFRSPLTDGLTEEQREAGLWVAENDHFIHLVRGQNPIKIVASFSLGATIGVIQKAAENTLKNGTRT
jgi:hypothetical protein